VLFSVTRPFSSGPFSGALAEIAGPELLDQASAIEASSLNRSLVIGPAIAGAVSGAASPATAIVVEAGVMLVSTVLVAVNPTLDARPTERADSTGHALRDGMRALHRLRTLRATTIASTLAALGWGVLMVGFPLYAARTLNAGAHAGGYLWAALALGSIVGTFALAGRPSPHRIALPYGILGSSGHSCTRSRSEDPACSGSIAVRQRHLPPAVRAQIADHVSGIALVAASAGAAIGGLFHQPLTLVFAFTAVLAVGHGRSRRSLILVDAA